MEAYLATLDFAVQEVLGTNHPQILKDDYDVL